MADMIEVMDALERCRSYGMCDDEGCPYYPSVGCLELLRKDALELLKEQVKTEVVFKEYDGILESECGNCGQHLDKAYSNCPKCNKALDWNKNQS